MLHSLVKHWRLCNYIRKEITSSLLQRQWILDLLMVSSKQSIEFSRDNSALSISVLENLLNGGSISAALKEFDSNSDSNHSTDPRTPWNWTVSMFYAIMSTHTKNGIAVDSDWSQADFHLVAHGFCSVHYPVPFLLRIIIMSFPAC